MFKIKPIDMFVGRKFVSRRKQRKEQSNLGRPVWIKIDTSLVKP